MSRKHRNIKKHAKFKKLGCFVLAALMSKTAMGNPQGGTVVHGNISIQSNGNTLNINQTTNKGIVDWQSFNINAGETTNINQPGLNSISLHRVTGNNLSEIYGTLNSNGTVMLVNPSGIVFGAGSRVDVGSLIATTGSISNADFVNGNYQFGIDANNNGSIINHGTISVADAGLAALVAPTVENYGVINARMGTVALGSGIQTVDLYGDDLIHFAVAQGTTSNLKNAGEIYADAGTVRLSVKTIQNTVDNVVNVSGVTKANNVYIDGGDIVLGAGSHITAKKKAVIYADRNLTAKGTIESGSMAFIETSAKLNADVFDGIYHFGEGSTWLIDPTDITINDATTIETALLSANVILDTSGACGVLGEVCGPGTAGDIMINDAIDWNTNYGLTLQADNEIYINAAINASGSSPFLTLNSNGNIMINQAINMPGGTMTVNAGNIANTLTTGANGDISVNNLVLANVSWLQNDAVLPSLTIANEFDINAGVIWRDDLTPQVSFIRFAGGDGTSGNPYQIGDVYGLQSIRFINSADYVELTNDIDATMTPAWNDNSGFIPTDLYPNFNGNNHNIDGLTISLGYFGGSLFGRGLLTPVPIAMRDFTMTNVNIRSAYRTAALFSDTGYAPGVSLDNIHLNSGSVTSTFFHETASFFAIANGDITVENSSSALNLYFSTFDSSKGVRYIGGIIGYVTPNSLIFRNVHYSGDLEWYVRNARPGDSVDQVVGTGGLIGVLYGADSIPNQTALIENSSFTGRVVAPATCYESCYFPYFGGMIGSVTGGDGGHNIAEGDVDVILRDITVDTEANALLHYEYWGLLISEVHNLNGSILVETSSMPQNILRANLSTPNSSTFRGSAGLIAIADGDITIRDTLVDVNINGTSSTNFILLLGNVQRYGVSFSTVAPPANILLEDITVRGNSTGRVSPFFNGSAIIGNLNLTANNIDIEYSASSFFRYINMSPITMETTSIHINNPILNYTGNVYNFLLSSTFAANGSVIVPSDIIFTDPKISGTFGNWVPLIATYDGYPDDLTGTIAGTLSLAGDLTITNPGTITFDINGNNYNFSALGGADMSFQNISNVNNLLFDGDMNVSIDSLSNIGTLTTQNALPGRTFSINGSAIVQDDINIDRNYLLATNSSLTSNTGNITIGGSVDGAFDLTVSSPGTVTINGGIGTTTPVSSLSFSAADVSLTGGGNAVGDITLSGALNLSNSVNFTSTTGDIYVNNTIDGAQTLILNPGGGDLFINASIGATTPISSLVTNATNTLLANAGLNIAGNYTNAGATNITGTASIRTFGGDLNLIGNLDGSGNMTLGATGGDININSAIGSVTPLGSLIFSAANSINLGADINTAGNFTINAPINTATDVAITAGGNLAVNASIDGSNRLTLSGATTSINAPIGAAAGITTFTVNGGPTLLAADINAIGNTIIFNSPVVLGANVTLTDAIGGIQFNNTLDGGFNLNLNAGPNPLIFGGNVGGVTPLNTLTINTAGNTYFAANMNVGNLIASGSAGANLFGTIGGIGGAGAALLASIGGGASGVFLFNGCPIGTGCVSAPITSTPPVFAFNVQNQVLQDSEGLGLLTLDNHFSFKNQANTKQQSNYDLFTQSAEDLRHGVAQYHRMVDNLLDFCCEKFSGTNPIYDTADEKHVSYVGVPLEKANASNLAEDKTALHDEDYKPEQQEEDSPIVTLIDYLDYYGRTREAR